MCLSQWQQSHNGLFRSDHDADRRRSTSQGTPRPSTGSTSALAAFSPLTWTWTYSTGDCTVPPRLPKRPCRRLTSGALVFSTSVPEYLRTTRA